MPDKPKVEESLVRRIWWSMVSKAAERSSKTSARPFSHWRQEAGHFGCGVRLSRWSGIFDKPIEKDRVRGSL